MSENASYVYIHHYIEGSPSLAFGMSCCLVLSVVIVFMLVILLAVVIYVVIASVKRRRSGRATITEATLRSRDNPAFKDLSDNVSSCNAVSTQTSTTRDLDAEVRTGARGIPLSTFRKHSKANDKAGDSSESSAGLYDVLFPQQHEGEIVYQQPKSAKINEPPARRTSLNDSNPGPSGLNDDKASGSLDWDYFQQQPFMDRQDTSFASESEVEIHPNRIRSVCWV